ncbi:tRNA pseudouridine(55) synthase TruB [Peribacillus cavernae]|uniref:tRNA pseudouridine synthase B n=1 Tax=Peribacillus cavernae TaxID=1674310 RepID=A0A433HQ56_9BACI|nr:tRNA pseudouridine(55) synthase TruB [Peribacillus cavernae]MDQ0217033.1 tRNA pseudouridine55 synthase [Peribacillus cavernae]RUQ30486.1 tRNA pseudouridine(55) synthase TruB [Peribacillus cavernae]
MEGILPLRKPKGMTSHDCVFKLRKILKTKKVGHTGTLDPDVTGVLPICIGRATKIAEYITDSGKAYEGEVMIGFSTATEDASGEKVTEKAVSKAISREKILQVLASLTGEIEQTPPMYSAVKVNGKKLYEYARAGLAVERPTRTVTIHELVLLDDREEFTGKTISFRFRASCSKGTYIRTLAVMIGERLGYPAHMSDLIRIQSAGFTLDDCKSLEEVEKMAADGREDEFLLPLERGLIHLPKYQISDKVAKKVKNGAVMEQPKDLPVGKGIPFVLVDSIQKALAIYQIHPVKENLIKPVKVLI